jgi:hypothetical protein
MPNRFDQLYLDTMDEVAARLAEPHSSNLLRCCLLIRQLVADGARSLALLCNADADRRLRLRFRTRTDRPLPAFLNAEDMLMHFSNPSLRDTPTDPALELKLDEFLAHRVLTYRGAKYSVKQVLDFCAYVLGGVHAGEPDGPGQESLLELHGVIQTQGMSPSVLALRGTAELVHDSLAPLTVRIRLGSG